MLTRFAVSAVAAAVTLFATLFVLSKLTGPATSGALAIIGELDLFGPGHLESPTGETWCSDEPNETLLLAESFRELCDAARTDCGPECVRVSTNEWSEDCTDRAAVEVCVPANPLLGDGGS